jgi:muramoyltetrapeptide carboxypeptidase
MPLIPRSLPQYGTIGIVSPAGPLTKDNVASFEEGVANLRGLGYQIILGKFTYFNNCYFAGTDEQRACDLIDMFSNPDIDAIICSRGGYGAERILEYLDFDIIRQNPKIFVGYSNITFLLNIFYQYAGFITFHGPMVKDFNSNKPDFNLEYLVNIVSGKTDSGLMPQAISRKFNSLVAGISKGRLIGGNLTTLISTLGTKYEIDTHNKILFIEDIDEQAYRIDRMLTILKNSHKLECCAGFIIGDFTDCKDSYRRSFHDVISEFIEPLGKPAITGFKAGHGLYNITLPIGAMVEIDSSRGLVSILEPVVC